MATKGEVAELIAVLAASFPAFKEKLGRFTKDEKRRMIHAYHIALGDLDADLLASVVQHIIGEATFFPSAGEIRRTAFHLAEVGLGIPNAQDAWAEVTRMIRKGFYYQTDAGYYQVRAPREDDWSHPIIQKAVDAVGGAAALRVSENPTADRARFLQAYEVYQKRYREQERMLPGVRQAVAELGAGNRTPRQALPKPDRVQEQIAAIAQKMRF